MNPDQPLRLFTCRPQDVEYLRSALWPGAIVAEHNEETYEHLDFTWAHNAHRRVYPRVMQVLAERCKTTSAADAKVALDAGDRSRHAKRHMPGS